jgi:hypothetical protein
VTLEEMLALLPDNTAGEISPADMRTIVTGLYEWATLSSESYAFRWSTAGTAPTTGRVTTDQPWQMSATKLLLSETADDGTLVKWSVLDSAAARRVWVTAPNNVQLVADLSGPSVDLGTYRELPLTVRSVTGAQPANNGQVTVTLGVEL